VRHLALALAVVLAATSAEAGAPTPSPAVQRGWLTGLGLGLIGTGVASATLGLGFLMTGNDADALLGAYYRTPNSAPLPDEAAAVKLIEERRNGAYAASGASFVVGGVMVAGGIVCLLLDGRTPAPAVSVLPLPGGGGLVSVGLRW